MMTRIVIAGGGFAGINLAKGLAGKRDHEVVLVDKNNYYFRPRRVFGTRPCARMQDNAGSTM